MTRLVCIRHGVPGLTAGNVYPLISASGNTWVKLNNDNRDDQLYKVGSSVIFLNEDNKKRPDNKAYYEMLMSYVESVELAGGSTQRILEEIDTMSVDEMMCVLASNSVRFQYVGTGVLCT